MRNVVPQVIPHSAFTFRIPHSRPAPSHGTQLKPSAVPVPVQAPLAQPVQLTHLPLPHCELLVHQHGVPAVLQVPVGEDTLLQLPIGQEKPATETSAWQLVLSAVPLPVQAPVHWEAELTHLPLEQSESAAQRHAVWAELQTGAGESDVWQE
jgi:hypothetical protein